MKKKDIFCFDSHQETIITTQVLNWFKLNARELPWRLERNAYHSWLAEIIFQQTRINQGLPYYLRFIEKFPTLIDLANSSEEEVLRLWQGLGYYSRGRNLLKTAKLIKDEYDGIFPKTYKELLTLKGIGPYTAGAIASMVYQEKVAVVDGNVFRVLSRLFGDSTPINESNSRKHYEQLIEKLIPNHEPGVYNEAMIELGALVCKPKNPDCLGCPVNDFCQARKLNIIDSLPKKEKKLVVKSRKICYIFIYDDKGCYLKQRKEKDIWKGLYDFPEVDENQTKDLPLLGTYKHKLTHRDLTLEIYDGRRSEKLKHTIELGSYYEYSKVEELGKPKPIENFLKSFFNPNKLL